MLDIWMDSWQAASAAAALLCSFSVSLALVLTKKHHGHLTLDSTIGVQKAHAEPTPRVGGIGIYLGVLLAWVVVRDKGVRDILGVILLSGIPPLALGLLEDVTKRVGIMPRLVATVGGGLLAWLLTGISVTRLDLPGLDWIMTLTPVAVLFTAFAVGGVANAINIIDGFHGVASGTTVIALLALGAIGERAGDQAVAGACLLVAAAIAGFWLVNYPWGKLFMGDGGAYFSGFALAWLAVVLTVRNPGVSVWAALLVCAYPVTEVLYSVIRRRIGRRSPGMADGGHLHTLLETQLIQPQLARRGLGQSSGNAVVSPIIWTFTSLPAVVAVALFDDPALLALAFTGWALLYHLWYRSLAQKRLAPAAVQSIDAIPPYLTRARATHPRHSARHRRSAGELL